MRANGNEHATVLLRPASTLIKTIILLIAFISWLDNLGFNVTRSVYAIRVDGDNKPGLAADVTHILAEAGITLRGFSAAVIGARFIFYIGFDSKDDAKKAIELLHQT